LPPFCDNSLDTHSNKAIMAGIPFVGLLTSNNRVDIQKVLIAVSTGVIGSPVAYGHGLRFL